MPHEPLTGDALLDALSEVPGDPAEPVPARRRDYKLTPEDIAVIKDRQRREAEANPIFPPGGLALRSPRDIADQAVANLLDHVKRDADSPVRMVRLICPELRDCVPTQIVQNPYKQPAPPSESETSIINLIEEENPE